jgi:hypothetical protein
MTSERICMALLAYQICAAADSNKQLPPSFASEADKLNAKWFTSLVMAAIERQLLEHNKLSAHGTTVGLDKLP